jgi:hypothetical protein
MGKGRGVYGVFVGRPERKRSLGRTRSRWEDNIKRNLKEMGISRANGIQLARDRVRWWVFVSTVMSLQVP